MTVGDAERGERPAQDFACGECAVLEVRAARGAAEETGLEAALDVAWAPRAGELAEDCEGVRDVWKEGILAELVVPWVPVPTLCGGRVKTLAPLLVGVPMVKSSSKSLR